MDSSYTRELAAAYPDLDLRDNSGAAVDAFVHDPGSLFQDAPVFSADPIANDLQRPSHHMLSLQANDVYAQMMLPDLAMEPALDSMPPPPDDWAKPSLMPYTFEESASPPAITSQQENAPSIVPQTAAIDPPLSPNPSMNAASATFAYITHLTQNTPDLQHVLSPYGKVLFASQAVTQMLGYTTAEFMGKFVAEYVVPEDCENFTRELNRAATKETDESDRFAIFCRFKRKDGTVLLVEVVGRAQFGPAKENNTNGDGNDNRLRHCKCFFLTARPYQTKNSILIDSFLEHKIENVRLKRMIETLHTTSDSATISPASISTGANQDSLKLLSGIDPPHARRNSDTLHSSQMKSMSSPSSVGSATSSEQQFGSYTLSHMSPSRLHGKSGLWDTDTKATKKSKIMDDKEYVCKECGTLDSPEWRKGPEGPKTLCNACGLRWSKSLKKKAPPVVTAKHVHARSIS